VGPAAARWILRGPGKILPAIRRQWNDALVRSGSPIVALLSVLAACQAGAPLAPRPVGTTVVPKHAIRLEHAADRDAWQLTFTLPRAMPKVRFVRSGYPNRLAHWRITTPGLRLSREQEVDVIQAEDGRAFSGFTMDIATYASHPEKDYQAFVPYSDGSMLVYTGHFDVRAPGEEESGARTTFTLVPRTSERVVVKGEVAQGPRTWASDDDDGTYVYFGSTEPVVGDGFIGVVDAAMPPWLRGPMESLLPLVFKLYATRTGIPLAFRPTVFMSYRDDPSPKSISVDGGTLSEVVQLEVRLGAERRTPLDAHVGDDVGRVVAHEVAHLWNSHMFHHDTKGGDWMHEGGADAFAYEALRVLGRISEPNLREAEAEAFSSCLVGTRLGPIHGASVPGRFKLYYWCGQLVTHLTNDVFGFWGQLLREAPGKIYDEEQYLRLLRARPNGPAAESAVRAMLVGSAADPVPALLAADPSLQPTPKGQAFSVPYEQLSGRVVATLLLRTACGRDVAPQFERGGLQVSGACGELGMDPILAEVAGHDLRAAGVAAYDAAVAICATHPTVPVGLRKDANAAPPIVRVPLACPRPFLARPPHVTPH
jgi:hypothetical protein